MVMTAFQIVTLRNMLSDYITNQFPLYARGGHHRIDLYVLIHNTVVRRCEYIMSALERSEGEYRSLRYPDFEISLN